jgi:hypothetical protein
MDKLLVVMDNLRLRICLQPAGSNKYESGDRSRAIGINLRSRMKASAAFSHDLEAIESDAETPLACSKQRSEKHLKYGGRCRK